MHDKRQLDDLSDYKFAGFSDAGSQFGRLNFNQLGRKKQIQYEDGGVCLISDLQSDISRSSLYRPQFNAIRASSHNSALTKTHRFALTPQMEIETSLDISKLE